MTKEKKLVLIKEDQNLNTVIDNIATAPGDLPLGQIIQRRSLLREQFRHDNTISPFAPTPQDPVTVRATSGSKLGIKSAAVFYTIDGSVPDKQSKSVPMRKVEIEWDPLAKFLQHWEATIPPQAAGNIVRYKIVGWYVQFPSKQDPAVTAMDGQGFWFHHAGENSITTFAYRVEQHPVNNPEWMKRAVIYQIFLDRFHPGTTDGKFRDDAGPADFHGGNLKGVQLALPYLADLGVNCLWFSPIGVADTYHRYDSKDYFAIDPRLGHEDDLRSLIETAHAFGMRILLDFVPSHCSWQHPAFLAAQKNKAAESYSWFTFYEWPDRYRCFLDMAEFLPSFNTNSPGARKYIIDSALYWMREFGVDGYRLDHVIGQGMDFWVEFKTALEAQNAEVVTIGEATDTPDSLRRFRGRLHDILDFPLARALRHTFASRDWSLQEFDTFLSNYDKYMQTGPGRVSFLDNHDMERFLFVARGQISSLKMAALCQFSLTPTPTIYYGTEIGLSHELSFAEMGFGGDAEARRDMLWNPDDWDQDLLHFYQQLTDFRKKYPVLQTGERQTVALDQERGTYAYRLSAHSDADVIVAFNFGANPQNLSLPELPSKLLLATTANVILEQNQLSLPPNSGAWLTIS